MSWQVLVLDQGFQPHSVVDWTKAVGYLLSGEAEIVHEYDDVLIRSEKMSFKLPSVLRLLVSMVRNKNKVKFSRYNIFFRDKWKCQYCGKKKKSEELTFDHVIPKCTNTPASKKSWENIVTACVPCNRKKGGRTPAEAGMRLIKEPIKPKWSPNMIIRIKNNTPESWRNYLYWDAELEFG
jgi:5-methylcytosine-specific restriction endonuclease McrA